MAEYTHFIDTNKFIASKVSRLYLKHTVNDPKWRIVILSIRYWRYRGRRKIEGPKALSWYIKNSNKARLTRIGAVMIWKAVVVDLVYFFDGQQYWRYQEDKQRIYKRKGAPLPYPKTSAKSWHNIQFPVDDILTWRNNKVYFFKNRNVYKYQRNKSSGRYKGKLQKKHFIKSCRR